MVSNVKCFTIPIDTNPPKPFEFIVKAMYTYSMNTFEIKYKKPRDKVSEISKKNNYTYLLEWSKEQLGSATDMFYHGVRSCDVDIDEDVYYGSSKFTPSKIIPKKTILSVHSTRIEAIDEEIRYHAKHNVKADPKYYNRANTTSVGCLMRSGAGENNPMYGVSLVPWNKGLKGVQVAWNKGIPWSEEAKAKMVRNHKGMTGKKHTDEAKKKMSVGRTGKCTKQTHTRYRGAIIATHKHTGEVIRFEGGWELKAAGFGDGPVSLAISRPREWFDKTQKRMRRTQYKGYIWTREEIK